MTAKPLTNEVQVRYFREMVNYARTEGFPDAVSEAERALFWAAVEQNEVFCFAHSGDKPLEVTADFSRDIRLDNPFPVWSIEVLGADITSPHPDDKVKVWTHCMMVVEVNSGGFKFGDPSVRAVIFMYSDLEGSGVRRKAVVPGWVVDNSPDPMANTIVKIIDDFLTRLTREKDGVEEVDETIFVPRGKDGAKRRPHHIRRIFHVAPKQRVAEYSTGTRVVNWTHRWSVRGTWHHFWLDREAKTLDLSRIGKNRKGEYCVPGKTWRVAHVKGPESAELVKKVRVVDEETRDVEKPLSGGTT